MPNQEIQPIGFERINWEEQEKQTIIPKIEVLAIILINYTTALQTLRVISGDDKKLAELVELKPIQQQQITQANQALKKAQQAFDQAREIFRQTIEARDQALKPLIQNKQAINRANQALKEAQQASKQAQQAYHQTHQAYLKTLQLAPHQTQQSEQDYQKILNKDYTQDESPHIKGIATTIKRFSDTFTQIVGYRTKEVTITEYDHAPRAPSCEVRVRTYKAQILEAITEVLNREQAEEAIHQTLHKSSRPTDPLQLAAYEERIIKNVKYLCNGMRGLLNALIDLNDGKRITDDFRRGELRGLATLGLNPDQVRKLYPQREKMHKLINEFEDHTIESIFLS